MVTTRRSGIDPLLAPFQALGDPTRLRIVRCLTEGERCVCELQDDLEAGQSRLSFHLRKLRDAGLVTDRREGRMTYYALAPDVLDVMRNFLGEVKACCCGPDGDCR